MYTVFTLETTVTRDGNRRILYVLIDGTGNPVKAFVKGYDNPSMVTDWLDAQNEGSYRLTWAPTFNIMPREWNSWRKKFA